MVCQPHQYILVRMASYVPQSYVQSSNYMQQPDRIYTPPIAAGYCSLREYNPQKNIIDNYSVRDSLSLKIPEARRIGTAELFTESMLPELERENPAQSSYEVRTYLPQRQEEQRRVKRERDEQSVDGRKEDEKVDKKMLSELIEKELGLFRAVNQQVQHV